MEGVAGLEPTGKDKRVQGSGCVESPKSPSPGCGSTVCGNFVGMWALGVANNYLQILSVAYIYIYILYIYNCKSALLPVVF